MSQIGQAINFHNEGVQRFEEARRGLHDALGRMSDADKELRKGNLTPEAAAVWQERFDAAYTESERLKKLAASLRGGIELGSGGRGGTPRYNRPMEGLPPEGGGEQNGPGNGGEELGAEGGEEPLTFEQAERQVLGRSDVIAPNDARARRYFSLKARTLLNKAFRARGFASLSAADMTFLTANRTEQLMSPYIDRDGGMITGEEMRNEVITYMRDLTYIRSRAYKISTTAASVAFPSLKLDIRLTGTRAGQGTGQSPTRLRDIFGKTRFIPSGEGRIILVPEELLQDATYDVVAFIAREIAKNDLEQEEELFLTGTGSGQPLGIITALQKLTAAGYPGLVYPHTGSGGANFKPEDIKLFPYYLKAKYRLGGAQDGPTWLGCRAFIRRVAVMREETNGPGTGNFMFQSGLSAGDPNTLASYLFLESEFITDSVTSGSTGDPLVLFGNLGYYWIVDRSSLDVKVLGELYSETDEVGYKYSKRFDGAPVRPDPFIYMQRQ